ncbi:alpha/beta hydrolase fold-3 domain-containing protein [Colletotrichum eremochloae]|nr:alpha/beta hydrolase fold-3 domain-containing protein [Colletotrichum eremochloae]
MDLIPIQASFEPFGPITPGFVSKHHVRTDSALDDVDLTAAGVIGHRNITHTQHRAPSLFPSQPPIALSVFTPTAPYSSTKPRPCIFYIHGGGFIFLHWLFGLDQPLDRALETGAVLVSVEYRRAPEHPQPAACDDCFAGLSWVRLSADELGIDTTRIIVATHSVGSALAAGLALRARDENVDPPILAQMLPCPMLDDRSNTLSCLQFDGEEPWDRTKNMAVWKIATADKTGNEVSGYWAPARAESLERLPPAYLEAGSAEFCRDEVASYASRLWAAGGSVELHVWAGAFHGFDKMAPESWLGQRSIAARSAWVKRILG